MPRQDFNDYIRRIGECEDITQARELLVEMKNTCSADYDQLDTVTAERDQLNQTNESLRQTNMNLFVQISGNKPGEKDKGKQGSNNVELTYENLFNEKGELK